MNIDVTPRALAAGLESEPAVRRLRQKMKARMTLQAQLPAFSAHEQHAVGRSVRIVACHAAFHLRCRVLVNIRSALLHMALDTGFRGGFHETRRIESAVSTVTIRAFHQTLWYSVVYRLSKLTSNSAVTVWPAPMSPARAAG